MPEHPSSPSDNLPPELYREIVQHLHPHDDRHALQNVSLVSSALRREGQRVLFSMGPPTVQGGAARRAAEEVIKLKRVYTRFLSAILGENNLLAGYITEYKHYSTKTDTLQEDPVASSLMRALPRMHNLKSLHIDLHDLEHSRMIELSQIAAFQLHTLSIATPDRVAPFLLTTFLGAQPHLVHMDIIYRRVTSGYLDAIESVAGILPRLLSLRTDNVSLFERVALTHKIKALHLVGCHYISPDTIAALRKVKYLRLTLIQSESGPGPAIRSNTLIIPPGIDLEVEVLHLRFHGDIHQIIHNLTPQLGRLRMLIASKHPDYQLTPATSLSLFRRMAATAFSRSSSLLYVVVPNHKSTRGGAYLYRRSAAAAQTAVGAGPVMEELEFDRDWSDKSRPYWWMEWEDVLSGRSTLGLIHAPVVDMSDKCSSDGRYSS